jgi:glycosyltransferase involved in cell wall biosynthesis
MSAPPTPPVVVHLTTTDMSLDWLLRDQLTAILDGGYDVVGVSAPGEHVAALEALGVRHVPVPSLTRSMSLTSDLRAAIELFRVFRRLRPTIVHTHNPKPGVIGRIVGRAARVPIVVNTQHGLYAQPGDRRRRRWPVYAAERCAAACSDHEFVQSRDDVATLRRLRVPTGKLTDLGNGVDLTRFDPHAATMHDDRAAVRAEWGCGDDDVVAIVVGRLVVEKGLTEIVAMAQRLRRDRPHARVVVVGPNDTGKHDALDEATIQAATNAGVRFVGQRSDMPRCYAAADLFVTATYREGFPRAAMEAAAMGRPIVATDIRGCRQVVDHGRTGLLVAARDTEQLTNAVVALVDDPQMRRDMGSAAAAKAIAEFDVRRVATTIIAEYQRQLDRRGLTAPRR